MVKPARRVSGLNFKVAVGRHAYCNIVLRRRRTTAPKLRKVGSPWLQSHRWIAAKIRRLYCAAGVHRRPPFLLAQARELSGRIGAALQISAAPCARGGYDLSGPCLSDLIVRFRGFREGRRVVDGLPPHIPHQRLVLQESSTCNFYMRFQRTALVQEGGT